jgi:hypothetical protein
MGSIVLQLCCHHDDTKKAGMEDLVTRLDVIKSAIMSAAATWISFKVAQLNVFD